MRRCFRDILGTEQNPDRTVPVRVVLNYPLITDPVPHKSILPPGGELCGGNCFEKRTCIDLHTCVRERDCVCVRVRERVRVRVREREEERERESVCVYMYIYTCVSVCVQVCVHACACVTGNYEVMVHQINK